jgi:hypothetical protein
MISKDGFWRVMEAYGTGISPVQIISYIAAILSVGWVFLRPGKIQSLCAKLYLATAFAWTGIAFYMILAKDMAGDSYGNYVFGAAFIVVSALFAVDLFRQRMHFSLPAAGWQRVITLTLTALVFCYPLFGIAFGHRFPSLIMPGTFPCPTVALGLLLLATALPQVDRVIYILLLICAVPFTLFVQIARYGVYEDTILLITGIYSLVLLVRIWRNERLPI